MRKILQHPDKITLLQKNLKQLKHSLRSIRILLKVSYEFQSQFFGNLGQHIAPKFLIFPSNRLPWTPEVTIFPQFCCVNISYWLTLTKSFKNVLIIIKKKTGGYPLKYAQSKFHENSITADFIM